MTTITALPTPPSRADSTTFSTRGDAFLGALPTFVTEANAVGSEATAAAAAAAASASAAAASQSTASTAAAAVAAQSPVANAAAAAASAAAAAASAAAAAQTSGAVDATTLSASGAVTLAVLTASKPVFTDAGKNLTSTGVIGISEGGTGSTSTPTLGGAVYGTGSAYAATAAGTAGQVLTSNGGAAPTWQTSSGSSGLKNRIINGAMTIDQRNAGASVANVAAAAQYTLDRWWIYGTLASKFTCQKASATLPSGFANYLAITSSAATVPAATDLYALSQKTEGFNVIDFAWGTASAKSVTLSFRVYSSLTGTFGGSVGNSAANRSYVFSYSIPVANTWTTISVTIPGDTSGTWLVNNGVGLQVYFDLGCGTSSKSTAGSWNGAWFLGVTGGVNVVATNAATFYITGVQLELGSTATPFEQRPYGMELALCQRYLPVFEANSAISGYMYSTTTGLFGIPFPVTARVAPTGLTSTAGGSLYDATGTGRAITAVTFVASGVSSGFIQAVAGGGGLTAAQGTLYYGNRILFTGCEL